MAPRLAPLELSETHLAPRFARFGGNRRALVGQMRRKNPRISEDFAAFSGCCGKGRLERVKVFQQITIIKQYFLL